MFLYSKRMCDRTHNLTLCHNPDGNEMEIKRAAKQCGVSYSGEYQLFPFDKNRYTCVRLLEYENDNETYNSMDARLKTFVDDVLGKKQVEETKYQGYVENAVYGLLYLLKRNENECIVISNIKPMIDKLLSGKNMSLDKVDWSDIGLVWYLDEDNETSLIFPGKGKAKYLQGLQKCQGCKKTRFILSIVTLDSEKTSVCHANILLYDKVLHTLERFDPYETQISQLKTIELDEELEKLFKKVDSKYVRMIKPPDLTFYQRQGFQTRQEKESDFVPSSKDPAGYCQPFTFLYADTRMSFPDQDPLSIVQMYKKAVKEKKTTLTAFIRNYSDHLLQGSLSIARIYLTDKKTFDSFEDVKIPIVAICLKELSVYKTILV
jgi:hypothetical protein